MSNTVVMQSNSAGGPGSGQFVRGLGLLDATMIVAGSMIGSGIFIVSSDIARQTGGPGWLLLVWVLAGVLTLIAALSYGELAAMMPQAGGQYVYLREAYGPLWGFLYGWTLFLVIQTGTVAAVAVAFARFLGVLVPAVSEAHLWLQVGRFSVSPATVVAIGAMGLLTAANCTGLHTGKWVQNLFTLAKILSLVGLVGLGFAFGSNPTAIQANFTDWWTATLTQRAGTGSEAWLTEPHTALSLALALGTAMVGSLFASDAWHSVAFAAGEVKHPRRNLPLSLGLGVGLVSVLYLAVNLVYLVTLPLHGVPQGDTALARGIQFAAHDRVGTAAAEVMFGPRAAEGMAVLIMVSTFGCMNGLILAGARVYYAMARDGLFFRPVGALNRRGVPQNGLLLQWVWASVLAVSGTYSDLLDYVIFAVLLFYGLTMAGLFVLRRKRPDAPRPYKAFGYPVLPAFYILAASLIVAALLISPKTQPNTWPGLLLVLAGAPVYWLWTRHRRRSPGD